MPDQSAFGGGLEEEVCLSSNNPSAFGGDSSDSSLLGQDVRIVQFKSNKLIKKCSNVQNHFP